MAVYILGVRIDSLTEKSAIKQVDTFLESGQHTIFTPNPEMLVEADKDAHFKQTLNAGSLNICDGSGIQFVSGGAVKRIPGIDFMINLLALAERKGERVYLLGAGKTNGPERTARKLMKQFPHLNIVGFHSGPGIQSVQEGVVVFKEEKENTTVIEDIRRTKPGILFVAFGHKKQEEWINAFIKSLPSVHIAMGVGGAFDFVSGAKKRAPMWMRKCSLEWLYRLIREPRRIGRIWNATGGFLFRYYRHQKT